MLFRSVPGRRAIDMVSPLPVAIPGLVVGVAYLWAWIGLPGEGLAFSNDAWILFGPPSFEDAAFEVTGRSHVIEVTLRY